MANVTLDPPQEFSRAFSAYRAGRLAEAEKICQRIVAAKRDFFDALHLLAVVQMTLGKNDLALASFDRALAIRPDHADALNNRGGVLKRLQRRDEALASFERAIIAQPDHARAHLNRGVALHELKRHEDALASYDRALLAQPDNVEVDNNRGVALHDLERFDEALASYDRALAAKPDYAEALNNRGATLHALKRVDDALASYDRAIAARPDYAEALNNRGNALKEMKQYEEALASYDRALSARVNYANALNNRGLALYELRRYEEALLSFDNALLQQPDNAETHNNRGITLLTLKRNEEALASFDRAIATRPGYFEALCNRGSVLEQLKRLDDALASFGQALTARPDDSRALSGAANCAAKLCDWDKRTQLDAILPGHIFGTKGYVAPFVLLGYRDDPALLLQCARNYINDKIPAPLTPLWAGETWRHDRLRIAYVSSDFRSHAMAYMVGEMLETHDRTRFEIIGVSHGADDGSDIRKRLIAAFESFHDLPEMDDRQIAGFLRGREIDIAVNLQGYTSDQRPDIFARRPVPIQASYLGYPATMGTQFIDYVIADKIVAPFSQQQFYTESIIHLPDCYVVNDRKRRIAPRPPTRHEMGLPEHGFVFCCFNNTWKFTPVLFEIWIRLLGEVEGSVLWLVGDNEGAKRNLHREARQRGIDPSRLVFADRIPSELHLARHHVADLFLDTLPYNAHSTASDALRTGLPVLTCMGTSFPSRVAASQLHAIGIPELIVPTLEAYEALALKLARDPALLAEIKAKLLKNRDTQPLFDTKRFTRAIEAAYQTMWEIWQRGEAPRSFAVASSGNGAAPLSVEPTP